MSAGTQVHRAEKLMYPRTGVSKQEVVDYYEEAAPRMLPHVRNRPVSMERAPDGVGGEVFYQKKVPDYFPDFVHRARLRLQGGGKQPFAVIQSKRALLYLADQAVLTPHVWLSTIEHPTKPDRLVFDLDPPPSGEFQDVVAAARALRSILEDRGLVPFVMTTGGKGLHVVAPIRAEHEFPEIRKAARAIAQALVDAEPGRYTLETSKNKRRGRIFLDYLRNAYGQTTVAPYALRAREGAPIATPLEWDELARLKSSQAYTIRNVRRRFAAKPDDPWEDIRRRARKL